MIIKVTFKSHIQTYELLVLGSKDVDNPLTVAIEDAVDFLKRQIRNWEGYSYSSQEILSPNVPTGLCDYQIECLITYKACILNPNS